MILTAPAIVPFPYQQECLDVLKKAEKHQDTALVVKAGGLGKTITSALYVRHRFETYHEKRCLFLSHLTENLEQAETDYIKVLPNATYGYFTGDKKVSHQVNILLASFQTMRENLDMFHPEEFDIIVVDESHHSKAPTHENVVTYFMPHFILAVTATSDRMDGRDIRELYGEPVYSLPFVDALCRNLLCPVDYRVMSDEIGSLKKLQTQRGRLSINHLNRTVFVPKRDEEIVKIIQSNIDEIENPCVMIYVSSTDHAELLAEMLPGSIPIHSKIPKAERKTRLELFRQGIFKILISVDMFNESLDVPQINMVVFLRATDSLTVFYQQLMRGCRLYEGKKVVRVLDFVANCDRIMQVYELWSKVKTQSGTYAPSVTESFGIKYEASTKPGLFVDTLQGVASHFTSRKKRDTPGPFVLNIETVEFKEKIVPLIEAIKIIRSGYYATWQEAAETVKKLGITGDTMYRERFKEDPKLVSYPARYYEDFPGSPIFFGYAEKNFYKTWQEASEAAKALGPKTAVQYAEKRKLDPRLPATPHSYYKDFPGFWKFLGIREEDFYPTLQDAMEAAKRLSIKTGREYTQRYKEDNRLPSNPDSFYSDWLGWDKFFGVDIYPTWQEASAVVIKNGITMGIELEKVAKSIDPRLPVNPGAYYEDYPGARIFFGLKDEDFYPTWQEASSAARALGINVSREEFKRSFRKDPRLSSTPQKTYKDFPGWDKFLGREKKVFYKTWEEASKAALALGIRTSGDYKKRFREDKKFPVHPNQFYKNFPGWNEFLTVKN